MSEQLLTQILDRLIEMDNRLSNIEQNMVTKEDVKVLKDAAQALLDLVEKTYRKTEQIEDKLDHHANMLDVLATRTTHQEAEIKGLKIAK